MSLDEFWESLKSYFGFARNEKGGSISDDENLRFLFFTFLGAILFVALASLIYVTLRRFCFSSPDESQQEELAMESALLKRLSEKLEGSSFSIDSAKFLNIKSSKNDRPYYLKRIGTDPMLNLEPKTKKTDNVFSMPDITEMMSRRSSDSRSTSQSVSLDWLESTDSSKMADQIEKALASDKVADKETKTDGRTDKSTDNKIVDKEAKVDRVEKGRSERHVTQVANKEKLSASPNNKAVKSSLSSKPITSKSSTAAIPGSVTQKSTKTMDNPNSKVKAKEPSLMKVKASHGRASDKN